MSLEPTTRRRMAGGVIGTVVEWYELQVYAVSAPILAQHFFHGSSPTAALLGTFAIFAVAFAVRPLGGAFFGFLGDRVGRVRILSLTILLTGIANFAIGALPGYSAIGILAPLALLLCRLVQGFAIGGESSGGYSFMLESAPEGQRARWVAITVSCAFLGSAVGTIFVLIIRSAVGEQAYGDWVWRVPFLIGGVLALFGLWMRRRLSEPEEFVEARRDQNDSKPLANPTKRTYKPMLIVFLLGPAGGASGYFLASYMATYLTQEMKLSGTAALLSVSASLTLAAILVPCFGVVADRVGRKPVLWTGGILLFATPYPAFALVESGPLGAFAGLLLLVLAASVYLAGFAVTMVELFPTANRYLGNAISLNLGFAVAGAATPLISTALIASTGSAFAPAFFLMGVVVIALATLAFVPETKDVRLRDGSVRADEVIEPAPALRPS